MNKTSIEWTHRPGTVGMTWNPIRARHKETGKVGWACTHASTGCLHCYAETINKRFGTGLPFNVPSLQEVEFFLDEKILRQPLGQKKPATIFVGDMFDLFHEAIDVSFILQIFGVMAATPQHTYQLLTKRADRMLYHVGDVSEGGFSCEVNEEWYSYFSDEPVPLKTASKVWGWPLPNVWLGVSVENQKYADERITLLQETPAAVRFLSIEPMLEEISLSLWLETQIDPSDDNHEYPGIDWVICGGESGPGARPFNLAWAESLLQQCQAAGVPFFMKQVGSKPFWPTSLKEDGINGTIYPPIKDRKGGDPEDWPEQLRVRQFPSPEIEIAK